MSSEQIVLSELKYLVGVTSPIQPQIAAKADDSLLTSWTEYVLGKLWEQGKAGIWPIPEANLRNRMDVDSTVTPPAGCVLMDCTGCANILWPDATVPDAWWAGTVVLIFSGCTGILPGWLGSFLPVVIAAGGVNGILNVTGSQEEPDYGQVQVLLSNGWTVAYRSSMGDQNYWYCYPASYGGYRRDGVNYQLQQPTADVPCLIEGDWSCFCQAGDESDAAMMLGLEPVTG